MKYDEIWTLLEAPQWTNLFHITEDKCCIVLAAGGSCVTQDIKTRAGLQLPTHQQSIGSNVDGYILNPQHFGLCWFIPPKLTATYQMLTTLPVGTCLSNPLHRVSYSQKKETKTSGHFFPSWLHIIPHIVNERSSNLSPPVLDGKNQGTISLEKKIKKGHVNTGCTSTANLRSTREQGMPARRTHGTTLPWAVAGAMATLTDRGFQLIQHILVNLDHRKSGGKLELSETSNQSDQCFMSFYV